MKVTDAEIAEIDAWVAQPKFLTTETPSWQERFGGEYSARWGIVDEDGLQSGELVLSCRFDLSRPSLTALHRRRLIHRTDLVPLDEKKPNPVGALAVGAPAEVTGSHMHLWSDNSRHVRVSGFDELPIRRPTPTALRTFEQALAATCDQLNIHLTPDQRAFSLPLQGDLF